MTRWLNVFSTLKTSQLRTRGVICREHFLPDTTPVLHTWCHPTAACGCNNMVQQEGTWRGRCRKPGLGETTLLQSHQASIPTPSRHSHRHTQLISAPEHSTVPFTGNTEVASYGSTRAEFFIVEKTPLASRVCKGIGFTLCLHRTERDWSRNLSSSRLIWWRMRVIKAPSSQVVSTWITLMHTTSAGYQLPLSSLWRAIVPTPRVGKDAILLVTGHCWQFGTLKAIWSMRCYIFAVPSDPL